MKALPANYTDKPEAYEDFIRQFGTHYVAKARFGGVMAMTLETSTDYFE